MKQIGCLLVLWMSCMEVSRAQTAGPKLSGSIRDTATAKAIAYATITLLDSGKNNIGSTYSQENGSFAMPLPHAGQFTVEVSSVGYRTREWTILLGEGQAVKELGILLLTTGDEYLQEVKVVSRRRLVDQKPGMLVYNAENDISNKGGTAADVLRKAPVLNVDAQGNVSMRGSSNLKILINGKYSGQMARSAADALNMMPANMIKSVEVITTPSARYDAEGAAGVINIITKKGRSDLGGTLEAGLSNLEQMLNPRITYSNAKWNINFAGHIHRLREKSGKELDRTSLSGTTENNRLRQLTEMDNTAPHGSGDLSIDYAIDASSELSLGVNAWVGRWPDNSRVGTLLSLPDGTVQEQYTQDISSANKYLGADINLGYTKRFKKSGQQLAVLLQHSPSRDRSGYDAGQSNMSKELLYREVNNSKTKNREWTFQGDYTHPLNKKGNILMEAGAKIILRNVDNRYDVSASEGSNFDELVPQPQRSDNFAYSQDVLAGYNIYRFTLAQNWFIEAGARVEATYINGDFDVQGTSFSNRFVNFIPTATFSKKLDENNTLSLSYTKRLTRPYIWDLSPNVDASDPKNIESGNPQLVPEMAHQVELSWGLSTGQVFFLHAAAFWKQTDNAIIEYTETNAEGISFTSKQNLASNRQFGMNLSATANPTARWTINGNMNLNYFDYNSAALEIFRSGWGTDINLNTTYKFPRNYAVQAFGEYNTRQVTLLGNLGSLYHYSFAGKKEFKKARMTLTLAAINVFSKYVQQTEYMARPNFNSYTDNLYYNRALKLTVGWEFGGGRQPQRERKKIENSDINVQGKG